VVSKNRYSYMTRNEATLSPADLEILNNPERIQALERYALLDSPAEEAFDRLTRLASKFLRAPIALVSLVDDHRQFFKSCVGLPEPLCTVRQTPYSHSFCKHVVTTAEPLIIEDARLDERVRGNQAIPDLNVIAYLGMPLITSGGLTLGSFCVIDNEPRHWSLEDIEVLKDLSKSVVAEIEMRGELKERDRAALAESKLQKAETIFQAFMDNSPGLAWMKDVNGRYIYLNRPFSYLFNIQTSDWIGKTDFDIWPEVVARESHEHDQEVIENGLPLRTIELVPHSDGMHSWMVYKFLVTGQDGEVMLAGVGTDVTEYQRSQQAQARFVAILEATTDCVVMADTQGMITYLNFEGRQLIGLNAEEDVIGKPMYAYHSNASAATIVNQGIPAALREGVWSGDTTLCRADGREVPVSQVILAHRNSKGEVEFLSTVMRDITDIKKAEESLQESNERLELQVRELEQRNHEIQMLSEMGELLQACQTIEEAHKVISQMAGRLFEHSRGSLFLMKASQNFLELVAEWGHPSPSSSYFPPDDCWGLRRGRIHIVRDTKADLVCNHLHHPLPQSYLCVPMVAQGNALGLLHLSQDGNRPINEAQQRLAQTVAEQIALAVANLVLRETLRSQSIRDELTGLFNRRYMEESLDREIRRADRNKQPLGIIMLDIDHFKKFNDTYGHDAGDAILRAMGVLLLSQVRGGDIACRYGGEELTLILPDASLEAVQARAERVRLATEEMNVPHRGHDLGTVTVSLGVAIYPQHGGSGEDVLRAADAALYQAKRAGRNRVVVAPVGEGAEIPTAESIR